jgi:hypothetical protein
MHKKLDWVFLGTAQVSHQVYHLLRQFCMSSYACDYGGYKQGCSLLFASHIGHCYPKWYLKRNTSRAAHMLNELLEMNDAIMLL